MEPQQDQQTSNQAPPSEPPVQPYQPFQQDVQPVQSVEQIQPTQPIQQIEPVLPPQPVQSTEPVQSFESSTPQPDLFPDSVAAPIQPTQPQPMSVGGAVSTPPTKKSKKGLLIGIISGSVVLLGLIAAVLWYFLVYNNPTNVVFDAFSKVLAAKSGSADGNAAFTGTDFSIKSDISAASNEANQVSLDTKMTATISGQELKLDAGFVGEKDTLYIKLDGLSEIVSTMVGGSEYSAMITTYYGGLLSKVDGKWVVLSESDLAEYTNNDDEDASKCMEAQYSKLKTDASLRSELVATYRAHPLFIIESKGSDKDGNHYVLKPVTSTEAKKFFKALAETQFIKGLDDCTNADLKSSVRDAVSGDISSSDAAAGTIDLWIDGWSHTINKVALSSSLESGEGIKIEFTTKFNNNPTITVPKADTTFDDLKTEIEKLQQQFTSTYTYPTDSYDDYSTSLL